MQSVYRHKIEKHADSLFRLAGLLPWAFALAFALPCLSGAIAAREGDGYAWGIAAVVLAFVGAFVGRLIMLWLRLQALVAAEIANRDDPSRHTDISLG